MNNDFNNGQNNNQNQQGQAPENFGRSQEAKQAWDNGQTSWSNPGTPWSNVPQTPNDPSANTAQTLGIVGLLISFFCCGLVGIIMGIIACSKAKMSRMALGFEVPEARTGRICGIIAIVFGALRIVGYLVYFIVIFALGISGIWEEILQDVGMAACMLLH